MHHTQFVVNSIANSTWQLYKQLPRFQEKLLFWLNLTLIMIFSVHQFLLCIFFNIWYLILSWQSKKIQNRNWWTEKIIIKIRFNQNNNFSWNWRSCLYYCTMGSTILSPTNWLWCLSSINYLTTYFNCSLSDSLELECEDNKIV